MYYTKFEVNPIKIALLEGRGNQKFHGPQMEVFQFKWNPSYDWHAVVSLRPEYRVDQKALRQRL